MTIPEVESDIGSTLKVVPSKVRTDEVLVELVPSLYKTLSADPFTFVARVTIPTKLVAVHTPVANTSPSELSVTPEPTLTEVAVKIPMLYFSVPRPTVRSDPTLTN